MKTWINCFSSIFIHYLSQWCTHSFTVHSDFICLSAVSMCPLCFGYQLQSLSQHPIEHLVGQDVDLLTHSWWVGCVVDACNGDMEVDGTSPWCTEQMSLYEWIGTWFMPIAGCGNTSQFQFFLIHKFKQVGENKNGCYECVMNLMVILCTYLSYAESNNISTHLLVNEAKWEERNYRCPTVSIAAENLMLLVRSGGSVIVFHYSSTICC